MDRYERLASAFVRLADTLVADYDVVELTRQLIDDAMALLPISAAGIVLTDPDGKLHVFAASSEHSKLLELLQIQADAGPCLLACRSGEPILVDDLSVEPHRWPAFAMRAVEYGFASVSALPLRLRDDRIGALNLFRTESGAMPQTELAIGQALADVAAVGILHERIHTHTATINQQLQTALKTRLVIEQAKGIIAERADVDMDEAFSLLRARARSTQTRLADVAQRVVDGTETAAILPSHFRR